MLSLKHQHVTVASNAAEVKYISTLFTHACLVILTSVLSTLDTCANKLEIYHKFTIYLKLYCRLYHLPTIFLMVLSGLKINFRFWAL